MWIKGDHLSIFNYAERGFVFIFNRSEELRAIKRICEIFRGIEAVHERAYIFCCFPMFESHGAKLTVYSQEDTRTYTISREMKYTHNGVEN